ncbi:MAG: tRNA (adenosine(37)-N6)-threonylcarbamoyltransferase complex transferase subunit TsaD [Desulfobacterales bacterium]|nr:tRNA (adenosine(37)-N6)-threonylcarbamoyltransferase complex transferase subunit TsaD [Desulfobacterales bacterium]
MIVLGIESSCDETAAALVRDGDTILSSVVASQEEVHQRYGGVVPELASRRHQEAIVPVMRAALSQAGLELAQVEGLAATRGPGLIGSLLVGFSFAKALAFALRIPWVGVNHLEAHVHALFLESNPPPFPFVALLVSGGHTGLYFVSSFLRMELLGQTRDDAAGEAYDKVAKMLGLGYPGGAAIDRLARQGDPNRIRFPRPFLEKDSCDFSFSGIKTAVGRYLREHPQGAALQAADIAAGFQEAVVEVLVRKLIFAGRRRACRGVALAGGVAANRRLRERLLEAAGAEGLEVHLPSPRLCGDNAAMVAALGCRLLAAGRRSGLDDDVFSRVG